MRIEDLLTKKHVVLIYTGKKEICTVKTDRTAIRVGVTRKVPLFELAPADRIPRKIHGMETDVFETEIPQALRTKKHRPAPGGVSISHPKVTAGTLGMLVKKHGAPHILSNNHVLANSNDAGLGDQTWQPGSIHGGQPTDTIGHLSDWAPIQFGNHNSNCPVARTVIATFNFLARLLRRKTRLTSTVFAMNTVDCALARPLDDDDVVPEILEIGVPTGFAEPVVGAAIKISGLTSGLKHGEIIATDAIVTVNYGDHGAAYFQDQIITSPVAAPGDSGSAVLNAGNAVVGLLFAGSSTLSIANKISNVIEALGLERSLWPS